MAGDGLQDVMATPEQNDILKRRSRRRRRLVTERRRGVTAMQVAERSSIASQLASLPGYGPVCSAELAGETGPIARVRSESSRARYLAMATRDNSAGKYRGSKAPKHVNGRAKAAMMIAVDHPRKRVPQSQRSYENKRAEGKRPNPAIRARGRPLCRVIFKRLSQERPSRIDP